MGLRVVRLGGSTGSWGLMFGRGFCKVITGWFPLVIIRFVTMLLNDRRHALHDHLWVRWLYTNDNPRRYFT